MRKLRVAVLMGGPSPERDVSIATGVQVVAALDPQRYRVLPVEITREGRWLPRSDLLTLPAGGAGEGLRLRRTDDEDRGAAGPCGRFVERDQVDVAFIAMHGPYGEDGTMQGLLELLGIPYTGSGVLASALAMDKLRSRQIFEWHRIPVPGYLSVTADLWRDRRHVHHQVERLLGYPCVVKPNAVGSSIGVSLVRGDGALDAAMEAALAHGPLALVEEYVAGVELTCGILDDPETRTPVPLPLIEVLPHAEFYTYEAKYSSGGSDHLIPARVSEDVAQRAQALAVRAYQALGCEGMGRVDMIARDHDIVVLEVNTIPGMTATSLLPDAAKAAGISFPELLDRIIRSALRRAGR
ncbi:MAG: D-alanine--D-alanine ligase [Armatimonadota bacterium]|nr:D-alanine--D-alanine ligase [Armatimonadota bacterium]MDR7451704.1 D-alanine--D-alanine ligase [Armatimonadota bacterium]MDR7465678.1 D-alanine--D-alanine ligase [Armatimonadota bacterium]MDR7493587.1 D-alanine--D-alanine ligase [Armatimonadota bacterium]MDR7499509.1 D-alanine--D-alanine ligase [Armatimonadota bacterium]